MILDKINNPEDLKKLSLNEKQLLSEEIRHRIIDVVSKNGGHLASNLGTVELTIALYSILNLPKDKVVWDVGHQTYTHKILTERNKMFDSLRQTNGIAGFPREKESVYDAFDVGHSSTSISVALGMSRARDLKKTDEKIVAIIGDGALTSGMAMEALNDAGISKTNIIVILNDNEMSIGKNEGGLNQFLSKLRTRKLYVKSNARLKKIIINIPMIGHGTYRLSSYIKKRIKGLFIKNMYFENIGFTYLGPVNGHSISDMEELFRNASNVSGPVLIHIVTQKGNGYEYAMKKPNRYHSVPPFNIATGEFLKKSCKTYTSIMGDEITRLANDNPDIVTITAAMEEGTGLDAFAKKFPDRFFNVEICEEHAITMAAGMAKRGLIPVIAIYSSFLQRAYDQIIHDVCLTSCHVIFCIDRAGNTGNDGETHHGLYDLSYLNTIPNLVIMSPKNFLELRMMLDFAVNYNGPIAIRYPKGGEENVLMPNQEISFGKSEVIKRGNELTIVAIGKMTARAYKIANYLQNEGYSIEVINARFLKPLDIKTIEKSYNKTKSIITMEDADYEFGLGATIKKYFNQENVLSFGYKNCYLEHGNIDDLEIKYHLDENYLQKEIKMHINKKRGCWKLNN